MSDGVGEAALWNAISPPQAAPVSHITNIINITSKADAYALLFID